MIIQNLWDVHIPNDEVSTQKLIDALKKYIIAKETKPLVCNDILKQLQINHPPRRHKRWQSMVRFWELRLVNYSGANNFFSHYGKNVICRVQKSLPSAKFRALGKDMLCRVPHSAKYNTRQRGQRPALGKGRHSTKIGRGLMASSGVLFAECRP